MGVVGQIVPWNFPLLMAAWKLAPALACGNTAVLKPAETTPLTALLLAEISRRPSCRAGVVNIIPGDGAAGAALVRHPDIDKIAFTGSTEVGKDIQAALAGRDIGLTLELGGKSANIVFDDAAIDQAVEGIVNGIFFNQGHVCCAGSRLLLQESVAEEVIEKLWRADAPAARRRPARQEHRRRRDQLGRAARAHRGAGRGRRARGRHAPHDRLRRSPSAAAGSRRRCSPTSRPPTASRSRRSSARSSRCSPSARRPRRSRRPTTRAYGLAAGIWTDKGSKALRGRARAEGRRRLAEHLQPVRPDGRRSAATRRAASAARAAPPACVPTCGCR